MQLLTFHMHLFNVLAYTDLTYMICICYIFIFLNIKKHKNMLQYHPLSDIIEI